MLLQNLTIRDFRCYANVTNIPLHRLTVFVGENDAGKTVLLNALEMLLTNKRPSPDDFRQFNCQRTSDTIVIGGTFALAEHDTMPEDYRSFDGTTVTFTKTFTSGVTKCEVEGRGFTDERFNTFSQQPASVQKDLLNGLQISPGSNGSQRTEQFYDAVACGRLQKQAVVLEVPFTLLVEHLPRFQYISSADYKHPDSLVQRTLQLALNACLRPKNPETAESELLPELIEVEKKINAALNGEIVKVKGILQQADPQLKDVQVSPIIDFTRSLTTANLMIDGGSGLQLISAFGEGRKKKLWMALLEWERRVQEEAQGLSVVRAYDEPDVNLDYEAERQLFANILATTSNEEAHVQAIVCTHAVTMVDRAPAQSINLIKANADGTRVIDRLDGDTDDEVRAFLATVGRTVGISNSALFYERVFLVVEGESEENALPILYRHLYGHSFVEDRVVLINLRTCGAWKSVLNILSRNRAEITVMLLDQDCTQPGSSGLVTDAVLEEIGYPPGFKAQNCFYIGDKEFEDAFMTDDIITVLNQYWPKADSTPWIPADVDQYREPTKKFASDLIAHVKRTCITQARQTMRKPDLAEKLATHCYKSEQIPAKIREVFQHIRVKAGCESPEQKELAIPALQRVIEQE